MQVNYPPNQGRTTSFMPGQPAPSNMAPASSVAPLPTLSALPLPATFTDLEPINQREALANGILERGLDNSPTKGGPLQGLARMGQALVGGILKNRATEAMKKAKDDNRTALQSALDSGDISTLISSGDPIGQKLGAALMEQQFKRQGGPRLLTTQEKTDRNIDPNKVVQYDPSDGYKFLDDEKPMTSQGMISYDKGKTWAPIAGYVDNAKALHGARSTPKANTDQSGKLPWERKW